MYWKKVKTVTFWVFVFCFVSGIAVAAVVDFENLYEPNLPQLRMADGYGGFNWSRNTWAINREFYKDANWQKGTIGSVSIFGGYAFESYPLWLNSSIPGTFNLQSVYITSAYAGVYNPSGSLIAPEEYNVTVEGWRDSKLQYTSTVTVSNKLTEFGFGFNGVDTLWFKPEIPSQIIIDNMEYDRTPVPEPSSMWLLAIALLVFSYRIIGKTTICNKGR